MGSHRERVADFWDTHVKAWLSGGDPMPCPLPRWWASYAGKGIGAPTRDGFPEPYAGDLRGIRWMPRMVVLGLNPGAFRPRFQARDGIFAGSDPRVRLVQPMEQHGPVPEWSRSAKPYRDESSARGDQGLRATTSGRHVDVRPRMGCCPAPFSYGRQPGRSYRRAMPSSPDAVDTNRIRLLAISEVPLFGR